MKQKPNGSRLEETTALLQQAMATFLQNQVLFQARMDRITERMEQKFAEIDHRFDRVEEFLSKIYRELPEKVFGFGQAAAKKAKLMIIV